MNCRSFSPQPPPKPLSLPLSISSVVDHIIGSIGIDNDRLYSRFMDAIEQNSEHSIWNALNRLKNFHASNEEKNEEKNEENRKLMDDCYYAGMKCFFPDIFLCDDDVMKNLEKYENELMKMSSSELDMLLGAASAKTTTRSEKIRALILKYAKVHRPQSCYCEMYDRRVENYETKIDAINRALDAIENLKRPHQRYVRANTIYDQLIACKNFIV